jgi:hypothetical protein
MLFKSLQEHSGDGAMSDTQVFNALTAYSRDGSAREFVKRLNWRAF